LLNGTIIIIYYLSKNSGVAMSTSSTARIIQECCNAQAQDIMHKDMPAESTKSKPLIEPTSPITSDNNINPELPTQPATKKSLNS
jgi:hypothetical protein